MLFFGKVFGILPIAAGWQSGYIFRESIPNLECKGTNINENNFSHELKCLYY